MPVAFAISSKEVVLPAFKSHAALKRGNVIVLILNNYSVREANVNAKRITIHAKSFAMKNAEDRLRWARKRAGYDSAREAAEALGIPTPTYHGHENGGRKFADMAEKYARKFRVPVAWLMYGAGPAPDNAPPPEPEPLPEIYSDMVAIREVDVRAGAGGGGVVAEAYGFLEDGNGSDPIKGKWSFPKSFVSGELRTAASSIDIVEILGDSMEPTLFSGDRAVVDTGHKNPWPDGIFMLWDGYGVIVKRVEIIRGRDRPTIRCISDNERHAPFELELVDAHIIGRVIGKISTRV